jgi:hypothetical protein
MADRELVILPGICLLQPICYIGLARRSTGRHQTGQRWMRTQIRCFAVASAPVACRVSRKYPGQPFPEGAQAKSGSAPLTRDDDAQARSAMTFRVVLSATICVRRVPIQKRILQARHTLLENHIPAVMLRSVSLARPYALQVSGHCSKPLLSLMKFS